MFEIIYGHYTYATGRAVILRSLSVWLSLGRSVRFARKCITCFQTAKSKNKIIMDKASSLLNLSVA